MLSTNHIPRALFVLQSTIRPHFIQHTALIRTTALIHTTNRQVAAPFKTTSTTNFRAKIMSASSSLSTTTKAASDLLISHWQAGTTLPSLPPHLAPQTLADAFAIQSHVQSLSASPPWGWKIAATSVAGQRHINVGRPLAGRVLRERVTLEAEGQPVSLGKNRMKVAELEFAFRVGRDVVPRGDGREWRVDEVMECVDGLFLGSEVPDSRYEDFTQVGELALLADLACGDRYVLGGEVSGWRGRDLVEHPVRGWVKGREAVVIEGKGGNVLGDPKVAMTWIANELGRFGVTLRKGDFVTTGTCIVPIAVEPGDTVVGDYGDFGRIEISFIE